MAAADLAAVSLFAHLPDFDVSVCIKKKVWFMKSTFKIALGGVIAALCVVLMFLTAIIPVGALALPCICGLLLLMISYEVGLRWALLTYGAVALLSMLFVADKEAAVIFTMFMGYYPILKELLDKKLKSKALSFAIKLVIFNICAVGGFFLGVYILGIPKESFEINGLYLPWLFLLLGEVFFVVYEFCLTRIRLIYLLSFRERLFHKIK